MSYVFYISILFLGSYLIYVLTIYFFQRAFIFKPEKTPQDFVFDFKSPFEELVLSTYDDESLNCIWFREEKLSAKGCVLFHHGNAHNLEFWAKEHDLFVQAGFDVLFYDYRSYGKSTGKIKSGCFSLDARTCYDFLVKHYHKNKVIQFGRSLGTGIATRLAYEVNAPLLILETPYFNMATIAMHKVPFVPHKLLLKFPMRTDYYIEQLKCPIYIFHGTEDELIPHDHGRKLLKLNRKIRFISVEGGKHMNLCEYPVYQNNMLRVLSDFHKS